MTTSVPLRESSRQFKVKGRIVEDQKASAFGLHLSATRSSLPPKELLYDRSTISRQDSPHYGDLVIELPVVQDLERGAASARLGVGRAINQPPNSRLHDGSHAHRTRLNCNIKGGAWETVVAELARRPAQGQDLGVRGGIVQMERPVMSAGDDASFADHDSAHRNFVFARGSKGLTEGRPHVLPHVCRDHFRMRSGAHAAIVTRVKKAKADQLRG
jgi:hypothetical protein